MPSATTNNTASDPARHILRLTMADGTVIDRVMPAWFVAHCGADKVRDQAVNNIFARSRRVAVVSAEWVQA